MPSKPQEESDDDMLIDDGEPELDEYEAFDCMMGPDGQCGAAGSEDCEFKCPYRRDQYARERRKAEGSGRGNG